MGWVRIGVFALVKGHGGDRQTTPARHSATAQGVRWSRGGGSRKGGLGGAEAPLPHRRHTLAGKTSRCSTASDAASVVVAMPAAAPGAAVAGWAGWAGCWLGTGWQKRIVPPLLLPLPLSVCCVVPSRWGCVLPWLLVPLVVVQKLPPPSTSLLVSPPCSLGSLADA